MAEKIETFSPLKLNILSAVVFLVLFMPLHNLAIKTVTNTTTEEFYRVLIEYLIFVVIITIAHELLHAIGFVTFNPEVSFKDISFGILKFCPYCNAGNKPLTRNGAIIAALLPNIVIPLVLILYTIFIRVTLIGLIGIPFSIASGLGDYVYAFKLSKYHRDIVVYDLKEAIGFKALVNENT